MANDTLTPRRVLSKLYHSSPEEIVEAASRRYRPLARRFSRDRPVTPDFLRSDEYQRLMNRYVPCTGDYGRHEAETATKSFLFRAFEADNMLRAFRWRGIQENLDLVLDLIMGSSGTVVDLGGAASPFGCGSVIVDRLAYDADGNEVPYSSLSELPEQAEVILSSHTLEHIPELDEELERIRAALVPGGTFVAHIPAFTCTRWRAGNHANALFGDHVWTFGLSGTPSVPEGLVNYVEFDVLAGRYFKVESAEYCGDDSIFVVARRENGAAER